MSNQSVYRIIRVSVLQCELLTSPNHELGALGNPEEQRSLYIRPGYSNTTTTLTENSAIAVACRDSDVRNVKALIIGPPDTPYEFGFFDVGTKDDVLVGC